MPDDGEETVEIRVVSSLRDIPADQWDACAGKENPTVSHAFLSSLEDSGSVTPQTGWAPQHLCIFEDSGDLIAAVPLYLKNHSYGEYVFDWGWADAYQRAGGQYYPKLQCSVPFTPVSGPRLLVRADIRADTRADVMNALTTGLMQICHQNSLSSVHIAFLPQDQWRYLGDREWLQRTGEQFHWFNDSYDTFDGFLDALSSRKRKNIRKERERVQDSGLNIRALSGADLTEDIWDVFYRFYCDTSDRKWGQAYLERGFFSLLSERMADRVVLFVAYDGVKPVAGALNLLGADALFGRNWGCLEDHRFLHFELCYYQAIEYAIANGLLRVEAGAQGPHKLQRGYRPVHTYSAHWIRDPSLRGAVENYLTRERIQVDGDIQYLETRTPFRKTDL